MQKTAKVDLGVKLFKCQKAALAAVKSSFVPLCAFLMMKL